MRSTLSKQRARAWQFNATAYLNGSVYTLTLSGFSVGPYGTLLCYQHHQHTPDYTRLLRTPDYILYTEDLSHFYFRSIACITMLEYSIVRFGVLSNTQEMAL